MNICCRNLTDSCLDAVVSLPKYYKQLWVPGRGPETARIKLQHPPMRPPGAPPQSCQRRPVKGNCFEEANRLMHFQAARNGSVIENVCNCYFSIIINHLGAVDEHRRAEAQCPGLLPSCSLQPTAPHVRRHDAVVAQPQHNGARRCSPASPLASAYPLGR